MLVLPTSGRAADKTVLSPLPKAKIRGSLLSSATKSFCSGSLHFQAYCSCLANYRVFFLFAQTLVQWF